MKYKCASVRSLKCEVRRVGGEARGPDPNICQVTELTLNPHTRELVTDFCNGEGRGPDTDFRQISLTVL